MEGKNEVILVGYLRAPILKETGTGKQVFNGKIEVPFTYSDRNGGGQRTGGKFVKISAWENVAIELGLLEDGTPVRVHGVLNERSYDGTCKKCGSPEKKYWTDVVVDTCSVVE